MGIQDRDYYREDYARKNGMRYNKRSATYRADPSHWREDELKDVNRFSPGQDSTPDAVEPVFLGSYPAHRPLARNELSFVSKLFTTLAVALICAIAYRYLR